MQIRMVAAAAAMLALGGLAQAQELRIGMKAAIDGADPHLLFTPSRNVELHIYEPLLWQDERMQPRPWLATDWKATGPQTWELTLRDDVRFSNGDKLTAADVAFSLQRALTIEGLRTFRAYLRDIAAVEAVDPTHLVIHTHTPTAQLPFNLTTIGIVSAAAAQGASSEDFNGGRAAVGSGPYLWGKWTPGQDVWIARNPSWRGPAEPWSRVTFRFIPNDSARVAAVLAGDVDVIDAVPPNLYPKVANDARTHLLTTTSIFMLFTVLDQRPDSPYVTALDGSKLARNPLTDRRVRQAMDHALNRAGIAERAMEGGAVPAAQFMPAGFDGYVPDIQPATYDPALARHLLAEAGYPNGFALVLHCMNDRFAGDAQTCQATAQMFTAIGIRTKVEAMPSSVFFRRVRGSNDQSELSAWMLGYGTASGQATSALSTNLQTRDPVSGRGASNDGQYSNPVLDKLLDQATQTFDPAARADLVRQASRLIADDAPVLPVFHMKAAWGLRRDLAMPPRGDGYTYATMIRSVK